MPTESDFEAIHLVRFWPKAEVHNLQSEDF
jgi:hypothetical protein